MTKAQPQKNRLLPGFAGIALADILANSVAMIIILIVLTMMIKHEQEQARISEVEDITVLLSRDLATSVVMNGLPTSKPARLHDYVNSPLDANPHPSIMPIIELHGDYVRDYYTKAKFTRQEMLKSNNAFDKFLAAMNAMQKNYIRIDIYDIRMFYLAMSIISDHAPMPRHWHFIGYDGNPSADDNKSSPGAATEINEVDEETEDQSDDPGDNRSPMQREGDENGSEDMWEEVPAGISLDTSYSEENYPFDDLSYDTEPANRDNEQRSGGAPADEMFDALSKMMAESLQPRSRGNFPSIMRFRTATPQSAKSSSEIEQEYIFFNMENGEEGDALDYARVLAALFRFMEKAQQAVTEGNYLMLQDFNFSNDILLPAAMMPKLSNSEEINFYEYIKSIMFPPSDAEQQPLQLTQQIEDNNMTALTVHPNQLVERAQLLNNEEQTPLPGIPGDATVSMHVGLYPAIYKGLKIRMDKNSIILLPRKQADPDTYKWRIATIVSPQRDDYLLAFVYAAINRDGSLRFAVDQNNVSINQTQIATNYPSIPYRKENQALVFYGMAALLLLLGVLRRFIVKGS
ncbi:MAG: hypothetical protein GDA45_00485 [Chromatiales bacterium]|nr:hypothetical protein [Chromatiales bacterium]